MNDEENLPIPLEPSSATSSYAYTFCRHRESVQRHLKGQLDDDESLLPSFIPPASYWTTEEKNLFFHGITIYSRLFPDLIAAHIKTKNTLEVSLYLHCLQTVAAEHSSGFLRDVMPIAMEVSEEWTTHEDMLADDMNAIDSCSWCADNDDGQAQSTCSCPVVGLNTVNSAPKANAYLNHLDSMCLMTIENIIRQSGSKGQDLHLQAHRAHPDEHSPAETSPKSQNPDLPDDVPIQGRIESPPSVMEGSLLSLVTDSEAFEDKKLQRRLKKRLYMRRKRAEQSGRPVDPISIRLRPGRAQKVRKPSKPRPTSYKSKKKVDNDSDQNDVDIMYERHSKGGLTRPYRMKKILQENGIGSQMICDMGIDLFDLSILTRLMRLNNSLNEPTASLDIESISARTIQLFGDVTREFVSEIIRRAVVTKEQEIRMKRTMPVWKYERDEITLENVAECLYSMELEHPKRDKYLESLLGHEDEENPASSPSSNSHCDERHEVTIQESAPILAKDQLYRTPQHTLPHSMLWCSLPSLRSLCLGDDILPDEIDPCTFDQELEGEDELDIQDEKLSADHEETLWNTEE